MKPILRLTTCAILGLATSLTLAQQMRTVITYTTGQGSSVNSDKDQALSDATQTATNWANSSCIGTVTQTNVTFSQCTPVGSDDNQQYDCAVTVKDTCQIQARAR